VFSFFYTCFGGGYRKERRFVSELDAVYSNYLNLNLSYPFFFTTCDKPSKPPSDEYNPKESSVSFLQ
jgi:hypothetical protein